jgi:N-acetylglucosaminyldiphosphoundecaprenol N-acetyl-beta-D-mannosaminyltransferase
MIERTDFLGYPVDNVTLDEVLTFADEAVRTGAKHFIGVQNANKMYLSEKHPSLRSGLAGASIILPENAIYMGRKLLGKPLKQRDIGGITIMRKLLQLADERSYSVYLLGAKETNLNILVSRLREQYKGLRISGCNDGYFHEKDIASVVKQISEQRPNMLFVGLGSPRQEFFILDNFEALKANIMLGVGGSFNVLAGLEPEAPRWTKYGLEWAFRSVHDPKKFFRYLKINSFFLYKLFMHCTSPR